MLHNLRRQITTVFLLALLSTSVLSASASKEYNLTDAQLNAFLGIITSFILSDTTNPKVQALTKIQAYAQSDANTTTPTLQDYLDAQVTEVDARLLDAVNETMALMDATDVDSTVKIQEIVDAILSVPPVLTLIGEANTTLELGIAYVEEGATAIDALDGNLTAQIVMLGSVDESLLGIYTISYSITDEDNNSVMVERNVTVVDTTPPTITLLGDNPQIIELGTAYTELNATATDNYDGDLTSAVVIDTTAIDPAKLGEYNITYNVADSSGNSAVEMVRTVNVVDTTPPLFTSESNATVAENQTSAITLVATDLTVVTYGIDVAGGENFDINASTGIVTFKTAPDFEMLATYSFTATATDSSGNEAAQVVNIRISDIAEGGQAPKKTGQTKSYDTDGNEVTDGSIKDDGFYQKGTTPSYTRDDATDIVTDHITHLEWADDVAAKSITKRWLTEENYDKCEGENGQTQDTSKCTDTSGDTATTYCQALVLGGHSDWRLPTRRELVGLSDYGHKDPAMDSVFENTASSYYWSSTSYAGYAGSSLNPRNAWNVYFGSGYQFRNYKSHSYYVRCVRAGEN